MSTQQSPQAPVPPGIPGWRRAPCLGCDALLKEARPPWVTIAGTRDGLHLMAYPAGPERIETTFDVTAPPSPIFVLGVAHRDCRDLARQRLARGEITLADKLPILAIDEAPEFLAARGQPHDDQSRCPFCWATEGPTNEMTIEDIFPLWLQRTINELAGLPVQVHPNPWPDVTVPVCGACNNRWLSTLENDTSVIVKPMLGSTTSATLSGSERVTLATWALKIALLLDCYQAPGVVPHEFLKALATEGRPPQGTAVWLGARTGIVMEVIPEVLTEPDDDEVATGLRVVFSVGRLVFLVLVRFGGTAPFEIPSDAASRALVPLWPQTSGPAVWPAGNFSFGDDGAAQLHKLSQGDWVFTQEPPSSPSSA